MTMTREDVAKEAQAEGQERLRRDLVFALVGTANPAAIPELAQVLADYIESGAKSEV